MAAAAQAIRSGLQVMLPLDTSIVQLPNAKLLVSLSPTSASNPSTIISPVQQRLPLTRPAKRIARLAVYLDLIDVTTKRLPAFDLTPVFIRNSPSHIVSAISLEPSTWIIRMKPAFDTPFRERTTGIDAKIVD